jgi:hypothetical protein
VSGKQVKRERRRQRALGIEPALDRKRRLENEAAEAAEAERLAAEKYAREHPEEHARQMEERRRRGAALMRTLSGAVLALGGGTAWPPRRH